MGPVIAKLQKPEHLGALYAATIAHAKTDVTTIEMLFSNLRSIC